MAILVSLGLSATFDAIDFITYGEKRNRISDSYRKPFVCASGNNCDIHTVVWIGDVDAGMCN